MEFVLKDGKHLCLGKTSNYKLIAELYTEKNEFMGSIIYPPDDIAEILLLEEE